MSKVACSDCDGEGTIGGKYRDGGTNCVRCNGSGKDCVNCNDKGWFEATLLQSTADPIKQAEQEVLELVGMMYNAYQNSEQINQATADIRTSFNKLDKLRKKQNDPVQKLIAVLKDNRLDLSGDILDALKEVEAHLNK
jgi:restriction endonuclease Mrr